MSSPARYGARVFDTNAHLRLVELAAGGVVVQYELLTLPPPSPLPPLDIDVDLEKDAPPGRGPAPDT